MTSKEVQCKNGRLEWLAQVYSRDEPAMMASAEEEHLFMRMPGYDVQTFVDTFHPLTKLVEARGPLEFRAADMRHPDPDRSYASFYVGDEVVFRLYVRFEPVAAWRIMYWNSWPPLPDGVSVRPYESADAAGCVALERECPMEGSDGSTWIIDRGDFFDDYLRLMGQIDAAVAVAHETVVGFFGCALRPIFFQGADTHAVYQSHLRVHPDYRNGSVSLALASFVDPRRSFEQFGAAFPYAMVDPDNVRVRNLGFPNLQGVCLSRLTLPVARFAGQACVLLDAAPAEICRLVNVTHADRVLFKAWDADYLADRCSKVGSFGMGCYRGIEGAVAGVWRNGERNVMTQGGDTLETHLALLLDYGFVDLDRFEQLLSALCADMVDTDITHLCVLCDERAPEYALLRGWADDEQRLMLQTLPWLAEDFQRDAIYCDGVYV